MPSFTSLLVILLSSSTLLCSAKSCYGPDGSQMNDTITYQCPTTGKWQESMCCRSVDPSGASGADKCVQAGTQSGHWLCQNDDGSLWRRGCTDKSWKDGGCVSVCADKSKDWHGFTMTDVEEPVTVCNDGSLCCGPGTIGADCCNKGEGVWIVDGAVSKQKPPSTSTAVTQTVTVTNAASTATGAPNQPTTGQTINNVSSSSSSTSTGGGESGDGGISKGAVIGGAVGGAVIAIVLMGVAQIWIFRRLKKRMEERAMLASQDEASRILDKDFYWQSKEYTPTYEVPAGRVAVSEAPGSASFSHEIGSSDVTSPIAAPTPARTSSKGWQTPSSRGRSQTRR